MVMLSNCDVEHMGPVTLKMTKGVMLFCPQVIRGDVQKPSQRCRVQPVAVFFAEMCFMLVLQWLTKIIEEGVLVCIDSNPNVHPHVLCEV